MEKVLGNQKSSLDTDKSIRSKKRKLSSNALKLGDEALSFLRAAIEFS